MKPSSLSPSSLPPLLFDDDHVEYSVVQISGSDPPPACSPSRPTKHRCQLCIHNGITQYIYTALDAWTCRRDIIKLYSISALDHVTTILGGANTHIIRID